VGAGELSLKRTLRSIGLAGAVAAFCFGVAEVQAQPTAAPFFPPFGVDLTARDLTTAPGADFFQYANGAWLARTPIPPDKSSVSMGRLVAERTEAQLHEMMEDLAKTAGDAPADTEGKVGAFYAAFMDARRIDALGATPIEPELAAIRAATTRPALARLMGATMDDFEGLFFQPGIDADLKDPAHYTVYVNQAGLGLPDRDYYLKSDFAAQKGAYQAYIARLLTLTNWPDATGSAARIVAMETAIAEASWSKAQQRDVVASYNPMSPAELQTLAPGFDWSALLAGAKLSGKGRIVVGEKTAFPRIAAIFADTPVETLQAWLAFNVADNAASYLSQPFQDARFEFRDKTLSGQPEQAVRWKRGVLAVSGPDCIYAARACFGTLNWAVGQAYSTRHFTPETKAKIDALVGNLKVAFRTRIEALDWMAPTTKAEALKKLDTYVIKVGYPDHARVYGAVVIRRDDLVGDVRAAAAADWAFHVGRSDGPVDRSDWAMTPQTVDAYNGNLRDIVFPAAILQAPDFDPNADPAVNYGAIGAIIGHEMTHGFDDQGRTIDAAGALRDWWTPTDAAAFKARTAILGAQYATYEPVPGLYINPDLTMGENLADLGGLEIALTAYHTALNGKTAPVIDGLTGDQRLFLAYAQSWRGKAREDAIRQQTVSDPHSYRKFRVDGVVRNIDGWYEAFGVKPGDALWVAPAERARIW
jgi:putative endopeptidase